MKVVKRSLILNTVAERNFAVKSNCAWEECTLRNASYCGHGAFKHFACSLSFRCKEAVKVYFVTISSHSSARQWSSHLALLFTRSLCLCRIVH